MYEAHFGLTKRPFAKTPDPAFLYESPAHKEALARLMMAAEDQDTALLSGEIGAGKTTLSRALLDRLDERGGFDVALIINPRLTVSELLTVIADRLDVPDDGRRASKPKLIDAITGRLFESYEAGRKPLIIIDEAHLLGPRAVFEELRLLTNLQLDDAPLVGLLLVGQPELRQQMQKPALRSFAERVGVAFHLRSLEAPETAAYIGHRLAVAGRADPLFDDDALLAIHAASGGVPRRINTLCQGCLLVAYTADSQRVTPDVVDDVRRDFEEHLGPPPSPAPKKRARSRRSAPAKPPAGASDDKPSKEAGTWTS